MSVLELSQLLGNYGELIGAIAVLITLIYLAKQIRHSTEVSKVTSYHEAIGQIVTSALEPDFAGLTVKSQSDEPLSPEEQVRSFSLASAFIFGHEILLHLFRKGQIDEQLWENIFSNNQVYLSGNMILTVLKSRPGALSQDLLKLVEGKGKQ